MMRATRLSRALTMDTINKAVVQAQYAVRGAIVQRADEIVTELSEGKGKHPYESVVMCNIGNPQALMQKPLTFYREVLSLVVNPQVVQREKSDLLKVYSEESVSRATDYINKIGHWTATGAYTASKGYPWVRKHLGKWMETRDSSAPHNRPVHFEEITLTNGASPGIAMMLQALRGSGSVMIPVPQYPLYSATLALLEIPSTPYYLSEEKKWGLDLSILDRSYSEAATKPSALVVINPGNPTGQVLDAECMKQIIQFCYDKGLTLLSDEVYQENIYIPTKKFHSFREVLLSMDDSKVREGVQLASFHSTSKGVIGECGRRGGFMHLMNFPQDVVAQMNKLQSIQLCPNVDGQITTCLMTDPPTGSSKEQFQSEYDAVMNGYKKKAKTLYGSLSKVKGISCHEPEGAMYLFPRIELPDGYIKHAEERGYKREAADGCWALELLEKKGIVVVPGSGFGQEPGTYHFRTTILPEEKDINRCADAIAEFHSEVMKY